MNNPAVDGNKKRKRKRVKKASEAEAKPVLEAVPAQTSVSVPVSQNFGLFTAGPNKKHRFEDEEEAPVVAVTPEQEMKVRLLEVEEPDVNPDAKRETRGHGTREARQVPGSSSFYSDSEDEDEDVSKPAYRSFLDLKSRATELLASREKLPVYRVRSKLMDHYNENQVLVIIGETGSGKSTQIPQFIASLNKKAVAITQPRRVAAINLATRVSEEYGCRVGQEVGYSVRFQNAVTSRTKMKYLTDGMLLRELMVDPKLSAYSTVIIDEAHERTVLTDLILGFLKVLLHGKRRDLKVIVMSATLNADKFAQFFNNAPILFIPGKLHPVETFYITKPAEDIVDSMIHAVVQINQGQEHGDVLCFLPGQEEIDKCVATLALLAPHLPKEAPMVVPLPLYAALSPAQQAKIFAPVKRNKRKIILATNIAETSVTVPGVRYVVDSGLRKVKIWRHQLGLSTLLTAPISQASATQRMGRSGREFPGKTFRLYTEKDFQKLPIQTESEISRSDIISPVLALKKMGVDDILTWAWLEHPGRDSLLAALTQLYTLRALDDAGKITELGCQMAALPLAPHLSAVLVTAQLYGCLAEAIDIVSCLSVDNLVLNISGERRDEVNYKRRGFCTLGCKWGDLVSLKEFFDTHQLFKTPGERRNWCKEMEFSYKGFKNVLKIREQLQEYMMALFKHDTGSKSARAQLEAPQGDALSKSLDIPAILKSFLKGFISNTAIGMPDRSYRTVTGGQLIAIHPSSVLFGQRNDAIMYIEYVYTTRGYGRNCTVVELEWLQEVAPHFLGGKVAAA